METQVLGETLQERQLRARLVQGDARTVQEFRSQFGVVQASTGDEAVRVVREKAREKALAEEKRQAKLARVWEAAEQAEAAQRRITERTQAAQAAQDMRRVAVALELAAEKQKREAAERAERIRAQRDMSKFFVKAGSRGKPGQVARKSTEAAPRGVVRAVLAGMKEPGTGASLAGLLAGLE